MALPAMQAVNEVSVRALQSMHDTSTADGTCDEKMEFRGAADVAQIAQGVAFLSLAIFLIFANNAKIGTNAKAPLESRYQVSMTICTAVCLFSGFFNILQMTKLDDFDLPRSTKFTLDLSRPVEWVFTCPILQLCLVIIGGARLPSYRRFLMPLLTASNLLCGVAAMFSEDGMKWIWFGFGMMVYMLYTHYNIVQISENSDGEESLMKGDSDYRKLTIIVCLTWFPFPIWFFLSPEGFGLIDNITTVQLGWAILNVVAKFGFILHLQWVKAAYCKKLEAARELYGLQPGQQLSLEQLEGRAGGPSKKGVDSWDESGGMGDDGDDKNGEGKMKTLISESLISLGLSQHIERFTHLMLEAGICSTDVLERLNQDRAMDLDLPWSLVDQVQRRWRHEKMDLGQDKGGVIEKEDPFKKLLEESKSRRAQKTPPMMPMMMNSMPGQGVDVEMLQQLIQQSQQNNQNTQNNHMMPLVSANPADLAPVHQRLDHVDQRFDTVVSAIQDVAAVVRALESKIESTQESICQRMDFSQVSLLQTVNSCQVLLHKLDSSQESVAQKVEDQKDIVGKMCTSQEQLLEAVTSSSSSATQALADTLNSSSEVLLKRLSISQAEVLEKAGSSHTMLQEVCKSQERISQKMDSNAEVSARRSLDAENRLCNKMGELSKDVLDTCEAQVGSLKKSLHTDIEKLTTQTQKTTNELEKGMATTEERMADITRQNMMVMDMLTSTQERVMASSDHMEAFNRSHLLSKKSYAQEEALAEVKLRDVVTSELSAFEDKLSSMLTGANEDEHGGSTSLLSSITQNMNLQAQRFESLASKLMENSHTSSNDSGGNGLTPMLRDEMAAVALALSQQQREIADENASQLQKQVGETVREELKCTTEQVLKRVEMVNGNLDEGIDRIEQGLEQVKTAVQSNPKSSSSSAAEKEGSRRKSAADRG
eukprot:TRINITY_DN1846_c0_g1_i2.p1 TRINITY_DN1846_c0_g1~~TRINITY_DN1846_c0_g1_i2.p1  ORF type:complete len:960 (-),score=232.31 TRINITY_DN1846_c0_g1_i2:266-3073(-)